MADRQQELGFDTVGTLSQLPTVCTGQQLAERTPRRRSRRTDPPTSRAGESHLHQKLGLVKRSILAVADATPRTARELAIVAAPLANSDVETCRKRVRELCRLKLLREKDARECLHTGNRAATFVKAN